MKYISIIHNRKYHLWPRGHCEISIYALCNICVIKTKLLDRIVIPTTATRINVIIGCLRI